MLSEITNRQAEIKAEIKAEKARAAAKKAAKPPKPKQAVLGPPRQLLGRQSKDDANLKIAGASTALACTPGISEQLMAYHSLTSCGHHVSTAGCSCLILASHLQFAEQKHALKVLLLCREEEGYRAGAL